MPETTVLTDTKYRKLLTDLRKLIEAGKTRAQEAAAQELIQTYWELGKRISEEELTENAGYGESILEDLAEDLDMDLSVLKRALYFFQAYSNSAPRGTNLTWSHYRELIGISDEAVRDWYEKEASGEDWSRDQLLSAIRRDAYGKNQETGRGKKSEIKLKRPADAVYVYKALVERVIDGDTLLLRLDLGFQVWKEQRVRLAEIECPPIDDPKGYEAFEYVRDQLVKAPFIVLKTNKIDIYGRYVAHVFYSFTSQSHEKVFKEGRYLNQELLDKGFARRI